MSQHRVNAVGKARTNSGQQPCQGTVIAPVALGDAADGVAQEYHAVGVPLVAADNNRIKGWQVVRAGLAYKDGEQPRVRVLEGAAPNLCRTLPMMVHDPLDNEDLADKVHGRKTEDHPVDAFRYALMGEVSIRGVPAHDTVP